MTAAIEVEDLQLRYGDVTALDGLTVTLSGGGIHGLLGRNGSGKSSLLSVLAGFRKPTAGSARIGGRAVFEDAAVTGDVCLIRGSGDTVHEWPEDRVEDALRFAARVRPQWDAAYAAALVERFGLPPRARVGQLSRGQRSALGATLGLASRAPVTLFDESHVGMDAPTRTVFAQELLDDYLAQPRTIVLSTHLIDEASALFGEVAVIDRGRLVLQEEADAMRARGAEVTGPTEAVDRFVDGLRVLDCKRLGHTASATVYGELDDAQRARARGEGLDLGPVSLQQLFVHLTEPTGGHP